MDLREKCDKRMLYNLDAELDDIRGFKVIEGNNMLLVERLQDTSKYINSEILVVKSWNKAIHSERFFKVIKAPKKIFFDPKYQHSVLYDTDMEVIEGDLIYINHLESLNSYIYTFKDKIYHTIKYDNIQCVIRGEEVIPINGYVLLSPIKASRQALEHKIEYLHPNDAVVERIGIPNRDYKRNWSFETKGLRRRDKNLWMDSGYEEMKAGSRVRVYGNIAFTGMERDAYVVPLEMPEHRILKKPYLITHRPRIQCIIE